MTNKYDVYREKELFELLNILYDDKVKNLPVGQEWFDALCREITTRKLTQDHFSFIDSIKSKSDLSSVEINRFQMILSEYKWSHNRSSETSELLSKVHSIYDKMEKAGSDLKQAGYFLLICLGIGFVEGLLVRYLIISIEKSQEAIIFNNSSIMDDKLNPDTIRVIIIIGGLISLLLLLLAFSLIHSAGSKFKHNYKSL